MSNASYWAPPFEPAANRPEKLVLFDIDGTLLVAGGIHQKAFFSALQEMLGIECRITWRDYAGRTDRWIVKDIARVLGVEPGLVESKMEGILSYMNRWYIDHVHEEYGIVLPGVRTLLDAIDARGYMRGLVTGNLEPIAFHKLRHFGLEKGFALGGFGSDNESRAELLRIAVKKARDTFGFQDGGKNVVYVADTVRDVEAAHEVGIPAVVALTEFNKDLDFTAARTDLVLENLGQAGAFFRFLDSLHA